MKSIINRLLTFFLLLTFFILIQSLGKPLFLWEELLYHFEIFDLRGLAKGTLYLFTYFLAIVVFLIIIGLESFKTFLIALVVIFVFLSIDFFVQFLGVSHGFSLDEYRLAINEVSNYEFLIAYLDKIVQAMLTALLVVVVLYFIRKKVYADRFPSWMLLLLIVPFSIIYAVSYRVDTIKLSTFPAAIKIPSIAVDYVRLDRPVKRRILEEGIVPKTSSGVKNIVWVIDESVTGSYLSINGYEKETTPYLKSLDEKSSKISNFGVVNSISNCSSKSNLFLRIGMTPRKTSKIKEKMYDLPTIFQYAKRAGYRTWLFDSQTKKDHLQNYLTLYDRESIDNFETLDINVKREEKDKTLLSAFSKITNDVNSTQKNFMVIVKYGSHFPYFTSYDHTYSPFQPVMDVAYGGMDMEHKEEQTNTYLNSLYASVDLYLKELVERMDLSNSIVFYTSDHGQNLLETENLVRPHCNTENIVKNEVSVPLFVFHERAKELFPADENLFYSQIQMFPTTLSLFGYEETVVENYGESLDIGFQKSNERQYILSSSVEPRVYE